MATRNSTVKPQTNVAADIQAFAQFIEDTLVTTGGWVVTGDTGQTLPSALAATTGGSQKKGYRVYRMNDSLQASFPVFMRLDFGSAEFGSGNQPGIWVTIGTGSDGAGIITGKMYDGGASANPRPTTTGGAEANLRNCWGSAAPGRVTLAMFVDAVGGNCNFTFGLERTKDGAGNDTGAGLLLMHTSGGSLVTASGCLIYGTALGGQPTVEASLNYILTNQRPSQTFAPGDIGLGMLIHFKGVAQQPGANWMITNSSDIGQFTQVTLTLYSVAHTFFQCGGNIVPFKRGGVADSSARFLMRYD